MRRCRERDRAPAGDRSRGRRPPAAVRRARSCGAHCCRACAALAREDTTPYECDGLTAYRERPMVVALPETEAQVAAVLDTCHAPRRAGGRARRRHRAVGRRDAAPRTACCSRSRKLQPHPRHRRRGAHRRPCSPACAISRSPRRRRRTACYYAPDPSSQIACSIGGNVAENSGGVHCLKYGLTVHNVLQVRGFTVDGEPVEFGSRRARRARARPARAGDRQRGHARGDHRGDGQAAAEAPRRARCIIASFDDVGSAGDAVAAIIAAASSRPASR